MTKRNRKRGQWLTGDVETLRAEAQDARAETVIADLDTYMKLTEAQYDDGRIKKKDFNKIKALYKKMRGLLISAKDMTDAELFSYLMDEDGQALKDLVSNMNKMKGNTNGNIKEEEDRQEEDRQEEDRFPTQEDWEREGL